MSTDGQQTDGVPHYSLAERDRSWDIGRQIMLVTILNKLGPKAARMGVLGLDPYPPFYFDGPMPYNTWN